MRQLILAVAVLLGFVGCGGDGNENNCAIGALGCACTAGGGCDTGLTCDPADMRCEQIGGCACDTSASCQSDCACDPDCGATCSCDTSSSCQSGCACDDDCGGTPVADP